MFPLTRILRGLIVPRHESFYIFSTYPLPNLLRVFIFARTFRGRSASSFSFRRLSFLRCYAVFAAWPLRPFFFFFSVVHIPYFGMRSAHFSLGRRCGSCPLSPLDRRPSAQPLVFWRPCPFYARTVPIFLSLSPMLILPILPPRELSSGPIDPPFLLFRGTLPIFPPGRRPSGLRQRCDPGPFSRLDICPMG